MSKLSLTSLSKHALSKEKAQKIKAGAFCSCYCSCSCSCPPQKMIFVREDTKLEDRVFLHDIIEVE